MGFLIIFDVAEKFWFLDPDAELVPPDAVRGLCRAFAIEDGTARNVPVVFEWRDRAERERDAIFVFYNDVNAEAGDF